MKQGTLLLVALFLGAPLAVAQTTAITAPATATAPAPATDTASKPKAQPREVDFSVPFDQGSAKPKPPVPVPVPVPQQPTPQPHAIVPPSTPQPESEAMVSARVALQNYRNRLLGASTQRPADAVFQEAVRRARTEAGFLERQIQVARNDADLRRINGIVTVRQRALEQLLAPPAPVPADPRLELAYRAYAAGNLEVAEQLLSQLLGAHPTADGYALRGCSRYTRAMLVRDGAADLSAAAADFHEALRLNRALHLDKASFSPKLAAYLDSLR
jgi:hypothetical protein